jgi:hypothetical protein
MNEEEEEEEEESKAARGEALWARRAQRQKLQRRRSLFTR